MIPHLKHFFVSIHLEIKKEVGLPLYYHSHQPEAENPAADDKSAVVVVLMQFVGTGIHRHALLFYSTEWTPYV